MRKAIIVTMKKSCGHDEGPGHDCAYVDWRNSLVARAELRAGAVCGERPTQAPKGDLGFDANGRGTEEASDPDGGAWDRRWSAEFHREMHRLTADPVERAKAGLDAFGAAEVEYPDAEADLGGGTVH